ncbi:hypothetical protein PR048_000739 [Dryococelus australis]|uniref:Uncharacterized protein n=1 Tax=Dryococelus australis TaxID=614101 RepID=A0ABQ9IFH2_9NEOP|nr:hypothetical protein PR048_000739 [Dryococelus australis]
MALAIPSLNKGSTINKKVPKYVLCLNILGRQCSQCCKLLSPSRPHDGRVELKPSQLFRPTMNQLQRWRTIDSKARTSGKAILQPDESSTIELCVAMEQDQTLVSALEHSRNEESSFDEIFKRVDEKYDRLGIDIPKLQAEMRLLKGETGGGYPPSFIKDWVTWLSEYNRNQTYETSINC